jgi:fibronectin-binding autotransporter adhesin
MITPVTSFATACFSPARRRCSVRLALTVSAALFYSAATQLRAQSANSGDSLTWNGGTSTASWTSSSPVWYDTTRGSAISLGDSDSDQGQPYSYTFNGTGTNSTLAPAAMTVGDDSSASSPVLAVNGLTFNEGFAANDTTMLSSGHDNGIAEYLTFATGWALTDNAASGVVTLNTPATGYSSVLYLTLGGNGTVSVNSGASVLINTAITDNNSGYSITKTGGGVLTLAPSSDVGSSYSGGTTVNGGTLIVSGPNFATGTGTVTVSNAGSVLAGSGTIAGSTTINSGAVISPGLSSNTVGILKIGTGTTSMLTLSGNYDVDIVGGGETAGVNNDELNVTGTVSLNLLSSHLVLSSVNPAGLVKGQTFVIIADSVALTGEFDGLAQGATIADPDGDTYTINYFSNATGGTGGTDVSLTVASVVPEPSSFLGCLFALAALAGGLRRRFV